MKKKILKLKKLIKGPVFSIHTPFKKNGKVDYSSLKKYLNFFMIEGQGFFM